MHALLIALGSSGDVLPFCGLGRALRARGHEVTVAANPHFRRVIARAGLGFAPLGDEDEYEAMCDSPKFMCRLRGFRFLMDWVSTLIRPVYELAAAHRDALVVAHPLAFGARVAEERLGVRTATLVLSPAILRSAHAPPVWPGLPNAAFLPSWYKRAIWWATDRLILDPAVAPPLNAFRAAKGLPPVARVLSYPHDGEHLFVGMFPAWFAPPQPDWPRRLVLAGFPLHDEGDGALPADVDAFLDGGTPPLVFTPGTGNRWARAFFGAALDATVRLGARAIFLTPHREQLPRSLPPSVRQVPYVPLGRLLPRARAFVHHGGIGSAAAALAAGVPQLAMPFAHDQPDNAARLCRLGVAATLPAHRASGPRVAAALDRLLGATATAARTRELAARLRPRAALGFAASILETYAGAPADAVRGNAA
jgi:rhamnosyltransferase subunit B